MDDFRALFIAINRAGTLSELARLEQQIRAFPSEADRRSLEETASARRGILRAERDALRAEGKR